MSGHTPRFGLLTLDGADEKFDLEAWRFGVGNRHLIDRVLAYAAEQHVHDGQPLPEDLPASLSTQVQPSGTGLMGPGEDVYYRYARVDTFGLEGPSSPVVVGRIPNQIPVPAAPVVTSLDTGTMLPGIYSYGITWWTGDPRCETPISELTVLHGRGSFHIIPTTRDPAATGYNVYRKGPTETSWTRVAWRRLTLALVGTTDVGHVTTPTINFDDTPKAAEPPTTNHTFDRSSIELTIPYVAPDGETGQTAPQWKIYRTFDQSNWNNSLIYWGVYPGFTDKGTPGTAGAPRTHSEKLAGASLVELIGETVGVIPPGRNVIPHQINFVVEGLLEEGYSTFFWINEFTQAAPVAVRARLHGPPAEQPVIVSIERRNAGGSWIELEPCRTFIDVAETEGTQTIVVDSVTLVPGDALRALVVQNGGGGPQTDEDLTISLMMLVRYGSTSESYVWST